LIIIALPKSAEGSFNSDKFQNFFFDEGTLIWLYLSFE